MGAAAPPGCGCDGSATERGVSERQGLALISAFQTCGGDSGDCAASGLPPFTASCPALSPLVARSATELANERLVLASFEGDMEAMRTALSDGARLEARLPVVLHGTDPRPEHMRGKDQSDGIEEGFEVLDFSDGTFYRPAASPETAAYDSDDDEAWVPGLTPLMRAAVGGETIAVRLLLELRASLLLRDEGGMQPLHLACARGSRSTVSLLVSARADLSALDGQERDAFACLPAICTSPEWRTLLRPNADTSWFADADE